MELEIELAKLAELEKLEDSASKGLQQPLQRLPPGLYLNVCKYVQTNLHAYKCELYLYEL